MAGHRLAWVPMQGGHLTMAYKAHAGSLVRPCRAPHPQAGGHHRARPGAACDRGHHISANPGATVVTTAAGALVHGSAAASWQGLSPLPASHRAQRMSAAHFWAASARSAHSRRPYVGMSSSVCRMSCRWGGHQRLKVQSMTTRSSPAASRATTPPATASSARDLRARGSLDVRQLE